MNGGEAAKVLKLMFGDWDPFALREHEPDPDTGLMPCGCGGKAKCLHHLTPDGDYAVKCDKCKIMTDWFNSPEDAIKAFNTAMGWKGGAELRGGPANED